MNVIGKALAVVGAIVLTATAVALPDVCEVKAWDTAQVSHSINSNGLRQANEAAQILSADG